MSNIVKETAKELGVTQKELAEELGLNKDTLSNWSTGKTETPKWAIKLFELLLLEKRLKSVKEIICK